MQDNVKIYRNITPEKFEQLLGDVKAAGATVEEDINNLPDKLITLKGVRARCAYHHAGSMALVIVHKEFPANLMGNDKIFALIFMVQSECQI